MHKFQSVPALHLYNKLFRHMSPIVIRWSASKEQFELQGKFYTAYWKWCFNTFIVAGLIGFGSCIDVVVNRAEAGNSLAVISCGFASLSCLYWASATVLIRNKKDIVRGIIDLKNILKILGQLPNKGKVRTGKTWGLTSLILQLVVLTLVVIPFPLPPLCIWVGLDPFSYTFPKIMSTLQICDSTKRSTCACIVHIIVIFFRAISAVICIAKACRFFAVLFCMLIYILELIVRCIEVVSHTHLAPNCDFNSLSFLKAYTALRVAHKVLFNSLCSFFAVILGVGFFVILSCIVAAIRAYSILPIEVYWLMPLASMNYLSFVAFALPFAVKVYKSSEKMVQARKVKLSYHRGMRTAAKRKLDKREAAAIKPIVISCGGFFDLEKGAESSYFDKIFQRTVDGLLIPM